MLQMQALKLLPRARATVGWRVGSVFGKCRTFTTSSSRLGGVLGWSQGTQWQCAISLKCMRLSERSITTSQIFWEEHRVIKTPNFPESVLEGDVNWQKEEGDFVAEDEVIAEIETDKTALPVPSPVTGVLETLLAEDGSTVVAGQDLCKIKITDEKPVSSQSEAPPTEEKTTPITTPPSTPEPAPVPSRMPTPPPLPTQPFATVPPPPPSSPAPQTAPTSSKSLAGLRTEKRVKMNRMRQRIAGRLKEAQNTNAMLTTFNEVDMSNVIEMRKKFQESFTKKYGIKLGFMSPFVKAACFALQDQPVVNAVIDGSEIVYRDYVDISVAVATPKGLVVPVLRNVETMNYADIEKEIQALSLKAKEGTLAIEDMDGGTFTISNGGVFGSMFGTPIINPPQSAILGMHATIDRPVAINGMVEIRPMMYVALTYDHRLIDGREAVLFLKKIKSAVEDPRILLVDV